MAVLLVSFVVDGSGGPRSWSEPNRPNRRSTVIRLTTNFHLFATGRSAGSAQEIKILAMRLIQVENILEIMQFHWILRY